MQPWWFSSRWPMMLWKTCRSLTDRVKTKANYKDSLCPWFNMPWLADKFAGVDKVLGVSSHKLLSIMKLNPSCYNSWGSAVYLLPSADTYILLHPSYVMRNMDFMTACPMFLSRVSQSAGTFNFRLKHDKDRRHGLRVCLLCVSDKQALAEQGQKLNYECTCPGAGLFGITFSDVCISQ